MKNILILTIFLILFSCSKDSDSDLMPPAPDPTLDNAIVFWRPNPNGGIFTVNKNGQNEKRLLALPVNSTVGNPNWSPDNRIYFTGKLQGEVNPQLYAMQVDGSNLRRITNNLNAAYSHLYVAFNTDLLYVKTFTDGSNQAGIFFSKADGTQEKKVLDLSGVTLTDVTWSSGDNNIILYVSNEVKNANHEQVSNIFVMSVDGKYKQQLTKNIDKNKVYAHPQILGEAMVYTATPDVNTAGYQVYLSARDGSQEKLLLPAPSKAEDWKNCTWFWENLVNYNWYPDEFNVVEGFYSTGTTFIPWVLVTDHQHKLHVITPDGLNRNQLIKTSSFDARAKNFN